MQPIIGHDDARSGANTAYIGLYKLVVLNISLVPFLSVVVR